MQEIAFSVWCILKCDVTMRDAEPESIAREASVCASFIQSASGCLEREARTQTKPLAQTRKMAEGRHLLARASSFGDSLRPQASPRGSHQGVGAHPVLFQPERRSSCPRCAKMHASMNQADNAPSWQKKKNHEHLHTHEADHRRDVSRQSLSLSLSFRPGPTCLVQQGQPPTVQKRADTRSFQLSDRNAPSNSDG